MHNASVTGKVTPSQQEAYWRSRTHEDFMVQCSSTNAFTNSSDGRVGWGWLFPPARKDLVFVLDNGECRLYSPVRSEGLLALRRAYR